MLFGIHSLILALAVHAAVTSARAIPTTPRECKELESNELGCGPFGPFADHSPPPALHARAGVAPAVKGGAGKDDSSSGDSTTSEPAGDDPDSSPPITGNPAPESPSSGGDESTEPITGNPAPEDPTSVGDGSTEPITGDPSTSEPAPATDQPAASEPDPITNQPDVNQAIAVQKPAHSENIGQYRTIINWLKNPKDATSETPRLGKDQTLFWSSKDGDTVTKAEDYADIHNLKLFRDLRDAPQNPTNVPDVDTAVEDEWTNIASAALARASSGEVKVMLDPSGMKADTKFVQFEWPELMANTEVSAIRSINPAKDSDTKIIWTRGQATKPPVDIPVAQLSGSHQ